MMTKKTLLFAFFLSLTFSFLSADTYTGCEANAIVDGASSVYMNETNKTIKFIKLKEPVVVPPDEMVAWLKTVLNANAKTSFRLLKKQTDKLGYLHYRFQQTYDGYDVDNGVYYIHTKNEKVFTANGEFYADIAVNANIVISDQEAIAIGKNHIHGHQWAWAEDEFPIPELYIATTKEGYHLTYKTDIYALEPLNRKWLMIDVGNGEIVAEYNRIHNNSVEGEAHCRYHGVQTIVVDSLSPTDYRLHDDTRGGGVMTYDMNEGTEYNDAVDFTDEDNIWDTTTDYDDAALDAHWGTEGMYDYMVDVHGWESYDGIGSPMISYVHYGQDFYNAFWNGEAMTYGDGNGVTAFPLTSTEVVGHEIMHGVTENTAALIYADESGGINEAFSDCFGVILDYYLNPSTANYLIGDDFSTTGTPFRNMGNPNEYENPDTYGGLYWDFNEVHNWSGVQNFWFYLLTQGGVGTNDIGDDYVVNPILMSEAADILFRSLSTYLTPNSNYEDARFYSIQSATELYGECSKQVINVANAWYAVGVGEPYTDAVVAGFFASTTYSCDFPVFINFTNTSFNGATYKWTFGTGTISSNPNPNISFSQPGTYTITLIAKNPDLPCNAADTLILVDYITIDDVGSPIAPSCTPLSTSGTAVHGVYKFELGSITNFTDGGTDNYKDYSCSHITELQEGVLYPFTVQTGEDDNIRIWIDINGDGVFNNTDELVYQSPVETNIHQGQILIPDTDLYGQTLRLRIKADVFFSDISNPCTNVVNGQAEDYGVLISENLQAPLPDFVADQTIVNPGSTIQFTDLTQNLPTGWLWAFDGGTPATSTEQHPSVIYSNLGVYPVSLTSMNAQGEVTETKTEYITVTTIATMCTEETTAMPTGLTYDSGGLDGDYDNNESCEFLIDAGCAQQVDLEFTSFATEAGFDFLSIYDGVDDTAPLIGIYDGNNSPGTVTATSGKMYILFTSDNIETRAGWSANWTIVGIGAPCAEFEYIFIDECTGQVQFTDLSLSTPTSWLWDFGDGDMSTDQNPEHTYLTPGTYDVILTSTNDLGFNTYTISVTIPAPLDVEIQAISATEINTSIDFMANTNGATTWLWDFGDGGATSTEEMPTYSYTDVGQYTVTLTVTNDIGCSATTTTLVDILASGIAELETAISVFPNPSDGNIYITNTSNERFYEIEVVNAIGEVVKWVDTKEFSGDTYHLNLIDFAAGMYVVNLKFGADEVLRKRVVLEGGE